MKEKFIKTFNTDFDFNIIISDDIKKLYVKAKQSTSSNEVEKYL